MQLPSVLCEVHACHQLSTGRRKVASQGRLERGGMPGMRLYVTEVEEEEDEEEEEEEERRRRRNRSSGIHN
ncbi:hypothetical protein E2C01_026274 [Portunus trituberculatus]|uniref:Uncharacterized protein n=1 Tax=Portunus trituberculatus TaxID=210409 RepID=A0A5B7EHN5_PORTR|nr:hypothetical protein [Portunus trituberculatus]